MIRSIALAMCLISAVPLSAQSSERPLCAPRGVLIETLGERHADGSRPPGARLAPRIVDVLAAPNAGAYVMLLTRADGIGCVVAAGPHWALLHPASPGIAAMQLR